MGAERKYRAGAYIPRIVQVLTDTHKPLTRREIAGALGTSPESIATAMLELTRTGQVVKLAHTPAVAATYRLPIHIPKLDHDKRTWLSPKAFAWTEQVPVSLPREPWADTVPAERMGAGQDARKPKGVSA